MPAHASATVVVCDPRADRAAMFDTVLAGCGVRYRRLDDGALTHVPHADPYGVALIAADRIPHAEFHLLDAIALLKHKGYVVLCYADRAGEWPLGQQCRLLLAGAGYLLDSSGARFGDELRERLLALMEAERERETEAHRLREQMRTLGLVGDSAMIGNVFRWVQRVAPLSDLPVLISGETGTGKELVARSIHRLDSRRCHGPFIAVNCGAISAGLAESDLFGHRRGAYTGADHDRAGLVRAAQSGVLFLDEIGDLDPGLQGKLLRVLQEHRVLTLGEDHERPVNVRVIAATNRDLDGMVRDHIFRADLFHRLNVLSIRMPALRERLEDVEPLVRHFVSQHATPHHRGERSAETVAVTDEFVQALRRVDLPGNVRQLENVVRRALVERQPGEPLRLGDLPPEVWAQLADTAHTAPDADTPDQLPPARRDAATATVADQPSRPFDALAILAASSWRLGGALDLCEQHLLSTALDMSSGNRSRAARMLGISARSIFNKMRKHRLTA